MNGHVEQNDSQSSVSLHTTQHKNKTVKYIICQYNSGLSPLLSWLRVKNLLVCGGLQPNHRFKPANWSQRLSKMMK